MSKPKTLLTFCPNVLEYMEPIFNAVLCGNVKLFMHFFQDVENNRTCIAEDESSQPILYFSAKSEVIMTQCIFSYYSIQR